MAVCYQIPEPLLQVYKYFVDVTSLMITIMHILYTFNMVLFTA